MQTDIKKMSNILTYMSGYGKTQRMLEDMESLIDEIGDSSVVLCICHSYQYQRDLADRFARMLSKKYRRVELAPHNRKMIVSVCNDDEEWVQFWFGAMSEIKHSGYKFREIFVDNGVFDCLSADKWPIEC